MALFHVFSEVENRYTGVPMAGVQVMAKFAGSETVAPIFKDEAGSPFTPANTCVSDDDGMYSFYIDSGNYDLEFYVGGSLVKEVTNYRPAEVGPSGPANSTYQTTSQLESADVANVSAILSEPGKAGTFTVRNYIDFIAEVAADTAKVNYIRSVSAPSSVWVRTTILPNGAKQTGATSGLTVDDELAAKASLTGVARTATNLGTFSGSTIPANTSIKPALQAVASGVEARLPSADIVATADGKGAALVGLDQTKTGPDNTLAAYFSKIRNLCAGPFNAKGDGSNEDAKIQEWLSWAAEGYELEAPSGSYGYTTLIDIPQMDVLSIRMAGVRRSRFLYLGSNPAARLFEAGDNTNPTHMQLHGFSVDSAISMNSSSHAIVLKKPYQGYHVTARPGSLDGNVSAKIWHGIRIESGQQGGLYEPGTFRANGDLVQVLGDGATSSGADLTIARGVLLGGDCAVHAGGGFGGLYLTELLGYGNNYGLKCSRQLVDRANREIIKSLTCVWDAQFIASEDYYSPDGSDPSTNDRLFMVNSAYVSGPGFIGGGMASGARFRSAPYARIMLNSKFVKSPTQDAYLIEDATAQITGDDGCYIGYTGRDGIRSTVGTDNIQWRSEQFEAIGGERMSAIIRHGKSASMPVNASSGAIGNAGATMRFTRVGNTFQTNDLQVNVVDIGTATGPIGVAMPFTVKNGVSFSGTTNAGAVVGARMEPNTSVLVITTATGSGTPATSGTIITLRGGGEIYG